MALLVIASWEQTSGKQSNSHIFEQVFENKGWAALTVIL